MSNIDRPLQARLNKKGDRVLCGHPRCDGLLAEVHRQLRNGGVQYGSENLSVILADPMNAPRFRELWGAQPETLLEALHGPFIRVAYLAAGSVDRDGVWRVPERARRRLAQSRSPYRRPIQSNVLHYEYRGSGDDAHVDPSQVVPTPITYPAKVECPKCGRVSSMDADSLGVHGW